MTSSPPFPQLEPFDEFNRQLAEQVHPSDWSNPEPQGRYNLVVVGAGTAGLVAAAGAAGLGAKVALVERGLMGGDCLNVGCVPSKSLLSAGRALAGLDFAQQMGLENDVVRRVDFAKIMQRMRQQRARISPHDSAQRFRSLGVDLFLGSGRFTGLHTLKVEDQTLEFRRAVIATGTSPARLAIPGWDDVHPLTNESIFSLTELPPSMIVIGGGPIGCEMAQAFARFGTRVTLVEKHKRILSREDEEAAGIVQDSLERDGVSVICGAEVQKFEGSASELEKGRTDEKRVHFSLESGPACLTASQILVAVGRKPNVEDLGLAAAQVQYDTERGVIVNDRLQTSNASIFAAGDVASKYRFTHAADFMARTVIQNSLFWGRKKLSALTIPWCTYTSPELAQVGLTEAQAQEQALAVDIYRQDFCDLDRTILDGTIEGFVKVFVEKGKDKIVGATVVGPHAGDLISHLTFAMTHSLGLSKMAATIHPYPTHSEALRRVGDQYNRSRLTPWVKKLFHAWLKWTR